LFAKHPAVHDLVVVGDHITFDVDSARVGEVLTILAALGVTSLSSAPPTLEDLFLSHYGAA